MNKNILALLSVGLFVSILVMKIFVLDLHTASGSSMAPVIQQDDKLYGVTLFNPKRDEISTWNCLECGNAHIVKFTLAIPGDHLLIKGEDIYVNGKLSEAKGTAFDQYDMILGDDQYFLIGLNTNHSTDSRKLGTFSKKDHISRAIHLKKTTTPSTLVASSDGW
jgi:signal peptidase I